MAKAFEWRHEDDHCAQCDGYLDPMNSEVIAVHLDGRDLIWCGKECLTTWVIAEAERRRLVTPSRTDRQPPNPVAGAKGGETPVRPETTKHPDLVTHHEET